MSGGRAGDIYRAVGVRAGRGSAAVLYRTENLLEPTALMWVTAAASLCAATIRSMSLGLIRTRQVHFRTTLVLITAVGLHECGKYHMCVCFL